jgi:hypothetical protein
MARARIRLSDMWNAYKMLIGKPEGKKALGTDQRLDGRIMLKWILKKCKIWTGLIRLKWAYEACQRTSWFYKRDGGGDFINN